MKILRVVLLFYFLFGINTAKAQELYGNPELWTQLTVDYSLSSKWLLGSEFHYRMNNWVDQKQKALRLYTTYHHRPWVDFLVGVTFNKTFPHDLYPLPYPRPEFNVLEQMILKQNVGRWSVSHRFRIEQRHISTLDTAHAEYNFNENLWIQRFRYRFILSVPLSKKMKAVGYGEIFISTKNSNKLVLFSGNRLSAGITYSLSPKLTTGVNYIFNYIYQNPNLYERHHGIHLTAHWKIN